MPRTLYCWRCKMDIPMLNEREWQEIEPLLRLTPEDDGAANWRTAALEAYRAMTGLNETNRTAIWHHRIRLYGPPCECCGKPLRTPNAKWCAACGAEADPATAKLRHRRFMLEMDKGEIARSVQKATRPSRRFEAAPNRAGALKEKGAMAGNGSIGLLRWLAVLPGAFLAAIASTAPLHLVLYQTLTGSGLIEPYPELPERLLGPFAASAALVWAGARIAPTHKVMTTATLLGIVVLLGGTVLALGFSEMPIAGQQIRLEHGGLALTGAIIGAAIGFGAIRFEDRTAEK